MQPKEPVTLNDSEVEIAGKELSFDSFRFWSDTFRHEDMLRYQDESGVQYMITEVPETTTFEIQIAGINMPSLIEKLWKTGKRFAMRVENSYFNLDVDTARVEQYEDGSATIVADVSFEPLAIA